MSPQESVYKPVTSGELDVAPTRNENADLAVLARQSGEREIDTQIKNRTKQRGGAFLLLACAGTPKI